MKKLDSDFYKKVFAIALPIALQNIVTSVLNLIDTFMISALSTEAIAGVSLANKVFFLLWLSLFGISSGSAILTAQYWGAGDVKSIRKVLGVCLTLSVSAASFFSIVALGAPALVMGIFSTDALVIGEGIAYLRIIGFSYIMTAVTFAYVFILRSTGNVKLPVAISIFAIAVNTFLNWVLIYGYLGAPAMGVRGAAIATVIARGLECILLLMVVYSRDLPAAGRLKEMFVYHKPFFAKYMKTVLPVIGNELMWAFGVTMYDVVYGRMGGMEAATMGIVKSYEQFSFFLIWGLGNAGSVILGNSLGAGKLDSAMTDANKLLKLIVAASLAMGGVIALTAGPVADIFHVEQIVKDNIILALYVLAAFMVLKSVNMLVIVGVLRSGGDTTYALFLDGGAVWIVAVPLVFLAGLVLEWPVYFVYMTAMSEEVFKVVLGLKRMYSRKWVRNLVS